MKKVLYVSLILMVCMAFLGGSLFAAGQAEKAKDDRLHVALVVKNLTNPFFVYMKWGGEAAANKYDVKYTCLAPQVEEVEGQIRIIEDLIQQDVDAIVVVPIDSQGIVAGIERANQAGIPVFVSNTMALGGEFVAFAGIDHKHMAETMGQYVVDKLGGRGKVIELEGVTGAQSSIDRGIGFGNIFSKTPGIQVLAKTTADFNKARGMQVTEDLLVRFSDIDAIVAYNDSMALGAVEAVRAAGKLNRIMVTGTDANKDALESVRAGELTATVDSNPVAQAFVPVEAAIRYLMYKEVPPKVMIVGEGVPTIVDKSNVDEFEAGVINMLKEYGVDTKY
jgi:ribose transport system substrate-binding protein